MNVGADYSFSFYDGLTNALFTITDIQDVKITEQKHDIKSSPYNDDPRFGFVSDGFRVDFTIVRTSSALEDRSIALANAFRNGKVIKPGYFNQTINNPDGTVSRYQYTNFVVFLPDHGDISREKVVQLKAEGMASKKIQIA